MRRDPGSLMDWQCQVHHTCPRKSWKFRKHMGKIPTHSAIRQHQDQKQRRAIRTIPGTRFRHEPRRAPHAQKKIPRKRPTNKQATPRREPSPGQRENVHCRSVTNRHQKPPATPIVPSRSWHPSLGRGDALHRELQREQQEPPPPFEIHINGVHGKGGGGGRGGRWWVCLWGAVPASPTEHNNLKIPRHATSCILCYSGHLWVTCVVF